jgi:hypothetical protein
MHPNLNHGRALLPRAGILACWLVLVAAACGEETLPTGVVPTQATGRVRVVNAVSDPTRADRVNITVAGTPLAVNIAYGGVAPAVGVQPNPAPYYPVYVGSWPLAVRRTADTTVKVLDQSLTVAASTDYTVIVLGQTGPATAAVLTDDNTAPAAGNVRVRVVHASLSAPAAVDIYVTAASTDISTVNPTAAGVALRAATPYLSLTAGVYRVRVTATGSKTPLLDTTLPALAAGAARTVLFLDRAAGGLPAVGATLVDR